MKMTFKNALKKVDKDSSGIIDKEEINILTQLMLIFILKGMLILKLLTEFLL